MLNSVVQNMWQPEHTIEAALEVSADIMLQSNAGHAGLAKYE